MTENSDVKDEIGVGYRQPEDEWVVEQGLGLGEMALMDQTDAQEEKELGYETAKTETECRQVPIVVKKETPPMEFKEERPGWHGYVEWEYYPEKKAQAHTILANRGFPPPPEFQLAPPSPTNPVLEGVRWKLWHKALGEPIASLPDISWKTVLEEKHPNMLHLLQFPYNGEPPKRLVTAEPITPNPLHFVRNHGGIPDIEANKWDLRIDGLVKEPKTMTLADLQNEKLFKRISKTCTLQCSGTRRLEQIEIYPGEGDEMINAPWAEGAIGTATYVGVTLKSVIRYCGGLVHGGKHLEFFGADTYFKKNQVMNYSVSVPWSKVKSNEVLLCWEMNGEPLPKIHGYPVRALVMGYIGARSVKWLYRISALKNPTRAPVQSKEYLYFNQQVGKHNQKPFMGIQIQEMPVSSAIMSPWNKQVVIHNGSIHCKGWAYSGGGRWPERVELSADGGFSWYAVPPEKMSRKHRFTWRLWEIDLPVDVEGWIEIVARCWDNSLNTQPLEIRSAWNWGLHVTSSCHRIKIYSVNKKHELTRKRLQEFREKGESLVPITRPTEFETMTEQDHEDFWERHEPRDVMSDISDAGSESD